MVGKVLSVYGKVNSLQGILKELFCLLEEFSFLIWDFLKLSQINPTELVIFLTWILMFRCHEVYFHEEMHELSVGIM